MVVLFENGASNQNAVDLRKKYVQVSKILKDQILFSFSSHRDSAQKNLGTILGVREDDFPTLRIAQHDSKAGTLKYKFESDLATASVDEIVNFVKSFLGLEL